MANPDFTDENVTEYVNDLSLDGLKSLVDDMNDDFDKAFEDRFNVSQNQEGSLSQTPSFFKANITSAFEDLLRVRREGAQAVFSAEGLDYGSATGQSMEQSDVTIEVSHAPDCTWTVSITITK